MQDSICGKQVCILETRLSNMTHYSIPQNNVASRPYIQEAHAHNPKGAIGLPASVWTLSALR